MLPDDWTIVRRCGAVVVRQHRRSARAGNELDALNQTRKEIEQGMQIEA